MTSRPKDIPQDVWDAAREVVADTQGCNCSHCVGTIARAIMAATERERERCALIADAEWNEEGAALIRQGSQPPKPSNDDFKSVPVLGDVS